MARRLRGAGYSTALIGAAVGPKAFTVEAADDTGNMASRSHVYAVVYDIDGFFSPVDDPPTFNAVKTGRDIPVKFSLGGGQGLDIFAEATHARARSPRISMLPWTKES